MTQPFLFALHRRAFLLAACIALCVLFFSGGVRAHGNVPDRADSLRKASWALKDSDPAQALRLARAAGHLYRGAGDAVGEGRALQCMAAAHSNLGMADSAVLELRQALLINQQLANREGVLSCLQKLAMLQTGMGEVAEALGLLQQAETLAEQLGSEEELARTLNLKGAALETAGRYEQAIAPYFESIEIRRRTGSANLSNSYQNLASLYLHMGRISEAAGVYHSMVANGRNLKDTGLVAEGYLNLSAAHAALNAFEKARNYADSSLALLRHTGNNRLLADALMNRSAAYGGLRMYGKAQSDLDSAMDLHQQANNREGRAAAYASAAKLALMQEQPDSALARIGRGKALARTMGLAALRADFLSLEADAFQALGRYDEAIGALHAFLALKDSLLGERATEQLAAAEMREKYGAVERLAEVEKLRSEMAQETELRSRRTTERNMLVVAALLLLVLSLLLYLNIRHRRKLARQERQIHDKRVMELLRENELKVLNAALDGQEAERLRVAKDLHDRLGSMLSAVKHQFGALESRMDALHQERKGAYAKVYSLLDHAVQEVRNISHDMISGSLSESGLVPALQGLRDSITLEGRLDVELNLYGLERRLERRLEIAVYHMVQELVANALKHARPTELSMALTRSPGQLSIIISDNGCGFDPAQATNGMGLANVRSRAEELGGSMHIDSSVGNGTTVSIQVPLD